MRAFSFIDGSSFIRKRSLGFADGRRVCVVTYSFAKRCVVFNKLIGKPEEHSICNELSAVKKLAAELRDTALESGAEEKAVKYLRLLTSINQSQEKTMVAKFKTKAKTETVAEDNPLPEGDAPKKARAPKAAKPKAEKAAKPKAPKSKGAAGRSPKGLDDKRKIKLTDKGKEKVNSESAAGANLRTMKEAGTVAKAVEAGIRMVDINYAEKAGTIELS
jgi:hypothetical protein